MDWTKMDPEMTLWELYKISVKVIVTNPLINGEDIREVWDAIVRILFNLVFAVSRLFVLITVPVSAIAIAYSVRILHKKRAKAEQEVHDHYTKLITDAESLRFSTN